MAQENETREAAVVRLTDELHEVLDGSDFQALVLIHQGKVFNGSNGKPINGINLFKGTQDGWTILLLEALSAIAHKNPKCATDLAKSILEVADLLAEGLKDYIEFKEQQ